MPQQTDAAARTRLQDIDDTMHGKKLRVAGRVLAYDAGAARIVLAGRTHGALLVDVALCLDARARVWAAERLAVVVVIGHLECCEVRGPFVCALPADG
ncbi:hypothetical protein HYPSUDRAFT_128259 [Hypholoma sublateritium FD-334 SS-4]|uniref:Uncharacterized protein n=1 Tax=Hypholoma sublateritium (strain FD-334 SS-4) TaxID=945553 RepID=A0A0D2LLY4_HYPSF|nr:hypothetical protein HYPSUDRAFT_128259 [Hypholoma sublateritium FD-334 SS-4]